MDVLEVKEQPQRYFYDLLIDPVSGLPLRLSSDNGQQLLSEDGALYPILEQVPVLLASSRLNEATTDFHAEHGSTFHYADHYEKDAEFYDYFKPDDSAATQHESRRLHETIISRVPDQAQLILDIGCGSSWVAKTFIPQGRRVISTDISTKNPIKALQKTPHPHHFGLVADAFRLPLRLNSVDCVIASEIMEHVVSPQQFIKSLLSIIKPGGKLIITTPYREKIEHSLCVHCNRPTPRHAHLHSFHERNIAQLIPENTSWTWQAFSNMPLARLKTHVLLQHVPYRIWKMVDKLSNSLLNRPARLMIEITKAI